jgi:hypothetical protein
MLASSYLPPLAVVLLVEHVIGDGVPVCNRVRCLRCVASWKTCANVVSVVGVYSSLQKHSATTDIGVCSEYGHLLSRAHTVPVSQVTHSLFSQLSAVPSCPGNRFSAVVALPVSNGYVQRGSGLAPSLVSHCQEFVSNHSFALY